MKSNEQLRKEFEEQTGNKAIVFPACHGETGYASWEYQLWLEQKLLEEYAQQSQPSGMRWVRASERLPEDGITKNMKWFNGTSWQPCTGVYSQDRNRIMLCSGLKPVKNFKNIMWLDESSPAGAAEGASEGMAEALAKFFAKECKVGDPLLPIIDSIYDDWKLVYDKLRIETSFSEAAIQANKFVIEKYASLSPGVEDGSGWVKGGLKRYLAFYGHEFHPNGGMADLLSDHDTPEDALASVQEKLAKELAESVYDSIEELTKYRWWRVYDTVSKCEVPTPPGVEDNQTKKQ